MTGARRLLILTALATFAVTSCGGDEGTATPPVPTETDPPGPCTAQELPTLQEGGHLIGDTDPPVPYSSVPPTSGWHASGAASRGVFDEPLRDPELVLTLEVGDVVAAYDPARLDRSDVDRLAELAVGTFPDRLTVTPYVDQPTALSLLAWGVLQRCDELDEATLAAFVLQHADATHGH